MKLLHCAAFAALFAAVLPAFLFVYVAHATTHPPWYHFSPGSTEHSALPVIHPKSRTFSVSQGKVTDPKIDFGLDYKNITFASDIPDLTEKLMLRGWYVPFVGVGKQPSKKVGILAVHGGGRDRREFLPHVGYWSAHGLEVLMYDSSEHGISDGSGRGIGFGYREQFDVSAAAKYAKQVLGWERIVVIGTSVGATASLLAAAREPLIDAVIAENPFYDYEPFFVKIYLDILGRGSFGGREASRFGSIVELVTQLTNIIPLDKFVENIASFTLWWIGATGQNGPVHVVNSISPRPVFLIHGQADQMIPVSHSTLLFEKANEPKLIWTPEAGEHADVLRFYQDEYQKRILDFVDRYVPVAETAAA